MSAVLGGNVELHGALAPALATCDVGQSFTLSLAQTWGQAASCSPLWLNLGLALADVSQTSCRQRPERYTQCWFASGKADLTIGERLPVC